MGGAVSFYMSGIHVKRMENNWVVPVNPKLYVKIKRYVDLTLSKRNNNATNGELFANMNSHHQNKINPRNQLNQISW